MGQETDPGPSCSMAWVDVRDLADAHALALEKEEAGGNRIIVASGPYKWQDWRTYYWICLFRWKWRLQLRTFPLISCKSC